MKGAVISVESYKIAINLLQKAEAELEHFNSKLAEEISYFLLTGKEKYASK